MDEAQIRFLNSLGYHYENIAGMAFIVADASIIYKKQGFYGQTLRMEMALTDLSSKGCNMVYRISNAETGDEMFRAKTGMLFFDYKRQKVVPVPEEFKQKICNLMDVKW